MTFVEHWPAPVRKLDTPDAVLTAHQLRPDLVEAFLGWSGGMQVLLNGGPAVVLGATVPATGQIVVGLGDFAIRDGSRVWGEPAAGFWQRYELVEGDP